MSGDNPHTDDGVQADAYYGDEDMGAEELDLSFLDDQQSDKNK